MNPLSRPLLLRLLFLGLLALVPLLPAETREVAPLPRVTVHAGGHYLQTAGGRPFFWLGDTAWSLFYHLTPHETSHYLRVRAGQGFNVLQTVLWDEVEPEESDRLYGPAFADDDPLRPQQRYFDRVDRVLDEAASLGLYVAILPCWGDKVTWGRGPRVFTPDRLDLATQFGRQLAEHFRHRTNVIWMLGGDRPPRLDPTRPRPDARAAGVPDNADFRPVWRAMAEGITSVLGSDTVLLYHPSGTSRTSPDLHGETWLSVNGMQSGHGAGLDFPVWKWAGEDFALQPAKPTLDLEPNYEDHPVNPWPRWDATLGYFRDHDVRKQCYRSVLAGGCGVTYGHHAVWPFVGPRNPAINFADRDWIDALERPAARQMRYLRRLMESRPYFTRVPAPEMVLHPSPGRAEHVVASRDREGSYALIYIPNRDQTVTLDLALLPAASLTAWWYDPRTGFAHPAGPVPGREPHDFTSPAYGPDWVLVLDDAAAGYAPPGETGLGRATN